MASFFKVLIEDFTTCLKIPPAFIKEFGEEVPKKTILETYFGKSEEVEVKKLGSKFYFHNGWKKFVEVNNLETGDFLVFEYFEDYSKFKVKIYGKTCCEKQCNVVNGKEDKRNVQGRKRKREEEEEEESKSKAFERHIINIDSDSSASDDEANEIGGTQTRKAQTVEFRKRDEIKYGRMPPDYHNHIEFKSENPFFQLQLKHSSANHYLYIPKGFFREHMKENKRIKLEVSKRTWNMEITVYEDERGTKPNKYARVTRGWKSLVKEHHLEMGDVCIFEMIKSYYDSDHSVFHVHVYRWDHKRGKFSQMV